MKHNVKTQIINTRRISRNQQVDTPCIVFLTDFWGRQNGGINSFNIDLCKSVAKIVPLPYKIICIVTEADQSAINDARKAGVLLIPVNISSHKLEIDYADKVLRVLRNNSVNHVEWWIGHDTISGKIALKLQELHKDGKSKVSIIHHMDYEAYKIFQNEKSEVVFKRHINQEHLFSGADKVFAVGPYLEDSAKDLCGKDVTCLIPGLTEDVKGKPTPNVFKAITFGRLEKKGDKVKQPLLAIKALGVAHRTYTNTIDNPIPIKMLLIGVDKNSKRIEELQKIGREFAEREIPIIAIPYLNDRGQLLNELSKCNVCMMLSLHEGFGLVGWESIAAEVPVIISRNSGLYKFLYQLGGMALGCIHHVDITGIESKDIKSVSESLLRVFTNPSKSKNDIQQLKNLLLQKGYTWDGTAQVFLDSLGIPVKLKINKSPYKFLSSYEESDQSIFFGRGKEINDFWHQIQGSNLMLLFGKSGVGKTSFLRAGIIPKLYEENFEPIYIKCNNHPLRAIWEKSYELVQRYHKKIATKIISDNLNSDRLIDFLGELNAKSNKTIVIIVDQFEEFFILPDERTRRDFIQFLTKLSENNDIGIKIILSFREDFFVEMHDIGKSINSIFNFRFRLKELSIEKAKESILGPLKYSHLSIEEGLIDTIVNSLSKKKLIEPTQLQIVCFTLYNRMSGSVNEIRIEDYEDLGGVKGILTDYVDYALEPFDSSQNEIAKEIMKSMVSSRNTKVPLSRAEINELKYSSNCIKYSEVNNILNELVDRRLATRTVDSGNEIFELTHEYLINRIKDWIDAEQYKIKEAQDILRQEENNWKNHKTLMALTIFRYVNNYKDKLILDSYKKGLLLRTAIEYDLDLDYWVKLNDGNLKCLEFIFDALNSKNNNVIRIACIILLQFDLEIKDVNRVLDIIEEIGNPNVLHRIREINRTNNRIGESLIVRVKNRIEKRQLKNMVKVEGGKFLMGRDKIEIDKIIGQGVPSKWFVNEYPKRELFVGSFLIDRYLVTNLEYQEFNTSHIYPEGDEKKPATNVSWVDAKKYAEWLNKDLPTEEEWEKAARGIDGRLFPWGNKWDPKKCNTRLSGIGGKTDIDKYPDGQSPYGCYDMAGNVWEWTKTFKEDNDTAIVKGGSWSKFGILPWCSYRFDYEVREGQQNVGFRCVLRMPTITKREKK